MWFPAAQKILWTWISSPINLTNSNPSCPNTTSRAPYDSLRSGFMPACQRSPLCAHTVCDTSLGIKQRVASLVNSFSLEEKISNLVSTSTGSTRLGLPSYEWWNEALHGVGSSPGVHFPPNGSNFSYATSFGSPILTAASFDDTLIRDVARVIGKEARAFANHGFAGFDFWTPNINPFRDPRWGRGQETPGEDSFHVQRYTRNFIPGLQGDDMEKNQVIATCKHYAVYDVETGRHGNNYNPSPQDLADYFLAPFKTCVRDVRVGSVMCSYNSVNGIPACANEYLLEDVLRKHWNFTADYNYVVADCGAVDDIYRYHNFTDSLADAAAVSMNAGTDLDCGDSYLKLGDAVLKNHTTEETLDRALKRLYTALFSVGYFDGSEYNTLSFSDVATPEAQSLAYRAAIEGVTLLKNDGTLPLDGERRYSKVAMIGPFANATEQMQGNYFGRAQHITSPLEAFQKEWDVSYALGTPISGTNTSGFEEALLEARNAEIIFFLGGIDNTVESEEFDRTSLTWPGKQLDLISELSTLGKPLIVVQFGGGQVDDSALLESDNVSALLWVGYPGQEGGTAILDIIKGDASVAGRLPVTQYPASYADEVSIFDIRLRPNASDSFPGRTYKWYNGKPVIPFGYGLHYTEFKFAWESTLQESYNIETITSRGSSDTTPFANITAIVRNTGPRTSDYVGLLFISSPFAGPSPRPIKSLISYDRVHDIPVGGQKTLHLPLTLGSLARAEENGDLTIFPGDYIFALDIDGGIEFGFELKGREAVVDTLPRFQEKYNFTVPVHIEPPSGVANL
ncbi:glycoside hydrolase superfamily [Cadophora sp. MPI-SDFR-AT-0126]|nr:glycoside hydrolase superfamily [Leotiomycetes sp. MPI-SDFR-AT-0126]